MRSRVLAVAQLSVFHGVPGLTVEVYVNGKRTLNDFKPGMMAGPLELAAGTSTVAITRGDAKDDSDPATGPVELKLATGGNDTAVAHLKQDGDPPPRCSPTTCRGPPPGRAG